MSRAEPRRAPLRAGLAAMLLITAAAAGSTPPVLRDFETVLPRLQPDQRERLQEQAARWAGWSEAEREAFAARAAQWDALPPAERGARRERYRAAQALDPAAWRRVRTAAQWFAGLPAERQQELRAQFQALDRSERRGWLLGPGLGADYPALQPLLAQVPPAEHDDVLRVLRAMTPQQRQDLAVLVQRTPPQERERLRRELVSTAAAHRDDWLWDRLHR
jgi:hypothetical protein